MDSVACRLHVFLIFYIFRDKPCVTVLICLVFSSYNVTSVSPGLPFGAVIHILATEKSYILVRREHRKSH